MTLARPNAPFATLRSWLDRLEETGRLARTKPDIPLEFTLAAIAKRLDGEKATLFPTPGGHALSVISGLVAARPWIAEAMGVDETDMLDRYRDAVLHPVPWSEVPSDTAPVQQIVVDGDLDITEELPIPVHNEHDAGAYITAGLVIAANPRTGIQNVSINRIQISGPDRLGILILPRDLHRFYDAAEEAGEPLSVAIAIGVDPLTLLASQAILPIDRDELEVAGALHGMPLPVVKCKTNDVRVPAEAEIVIEGRLLPEVREEEGPFGEFPQYYGPAGKRQVIEIDAITRREDALFHTIVPAAMEHLLLGGIPREASLIAHLQRTFPSVKDVHLSRGGVCRYHLVVKIAKRWDGEPKNIMMGAFAGHADIKQVIVVDEDVDILDPVSVEWAVATRFQAADDLMVVAGAQGSRLDPSATDGRVDKMGLDATKPLDADPFTFTVVHVPGEDDEALDNWIEG
ncbi:MAG: 3-octaprenyl-4-hydroxybenzoate carboxy-lyase [Rhodospirillaceae bacterium]|nr:3-octaprenyl-4-hydroxybenzoate carboxy-lyase [Rhodospirillaceae bacterium]